MERFRLFVFIGLGLVLLGQGCNHADEIESLPTAVTETLSADQQKTFAEFVQSIGNVFRAVQVAKREQFGLSVFEDDNSVEAKMANSLKDCEINVANQPIALTTSPLILEVLRLSRDFRFDISAAHCPVQMSVSILPVNTGDAVTGVIEVKYRVLAAPFRELNDVTQFDFKGNGRLDSSANVNGTRYISQASGKGTLTSQKYGTVELRYYHDFDLINKSSVAGKGTYRFVLRARFPNFVADLRETTTVGGSSQFTINGQLMARADYYQFLEDLGGNVAQWGPFRRVFTADGAR